MEKKKIKKKENPPPLNITLRALDKKRVIPQYSGIMLDRHVCNLRVQAVQTSGRAAGFSNSFQAQMEL